MEMKTWKTDDGDIEVYQVLSGRCNSYLIKTEQNIILVDTSTRKDFETLEKKLISLIPEKKRLDLLVLTHTHYDHCQNAAKIKKDYKCQILMSKRENNFVEDGYSPLPKGTTFASSIISRFGNFVGKKKFGFSTFTPDLLIEDDHVLEEIDSRIEIVLTSGHSKGSISVILNREVAIVGDSMFGIFKNSIYPPFADDTVEMIKTWKKLLKLGCKIYLPGHGKEIDHERLNHQYQKYS